ncbi:MAG TPA: hypothetical protein VGB17_07765 [Pyrinomonadaceae bacterium]|jgi:hypothetical protein
MKTKIAGEDGEKRKRRIRGGGAAGRVQQYNLERGIEQTDDADTQADEESAQADESQVKETGGKESGQGEESEE